MSEKHPADKAYDEVMDDLACTYQDIPPEARDGVDAMRHRWKLFADTNRE